MKMMMTPAVVGGHQSSTGVEMTEHGGQRKKKGEGGPQGEGREEGGKKMGGEYLN